MGTTTWVSRNCKKSSSTEKVHGKKREWQTGFRNNVPWLSILSLISIVLLAIAATVVIHLANGKAIRSWKISPTVYLSIIATATGMLIRNSFEDAATIYWWRQSLRGTTLRELHDAYSFSRDAIPVFFNTKTFSILRWTSLAVCLFPLNGPLFQQAIRTVTVEITNHADITLPFQVRPMWNFTLQLSQEPEMSELYARRDPVSLYQPEFSKIVNEANARQPITIPKNICNGTCTTSVIVAGFDRSCSRSQDWTAETVPRSRFLLDILQYQQYDLGFTESTLDHLIAYTYQLDVQPFNLTSNSISRGFIRSIEGIVITSHFRENSTDTKLVSQQCHLRPAFIRLDLEIRNTTVSIMRTPLPANHDNRTVELIPREIEWTYVIGGWLQFLQNVYQGVAAFRYASGPDFFASSLKSESLSITPNALPYAIAKQVEKPKDKAKVPEVFLPFPTVSFSDPMPDIMNSLDDLCLRYSMAEIRDEAGGTRDSAWFEAHEGVTWDKNLREFVLGKPSAQLKTKRRIAQTVQARQKYFESIFQANFYVLLAAIVVVIGPTIIVSVILFSWRYVGRVPSMSPLELAKAFDAPVLRSVECSNCTASDIVDSIGKMRIKYGVAELPLLRPNSGGSDTESGDVDDVVAIYAESVESNHPGTHDQGTTGYNPGNIIIITPRLRLAMRVEDESIPPSRKIVYL